MINFIFAFILATVVANLTEWIVHKYILHGLGKNKKSLFHYHWTHHNRCRKNNNKDVIYSDKELNKDIYKEAGSIIFIGLFNITWLFVWPAFFFCLLFWSVAYFLCHAKSHTDAEWGNKWMPWHRDHHMGKNQDLNWCVTLPLFDYVFGTRKKYIYDDNGKCIGES